MRYRVLQGMMGDWSIGIRGSRVAYMSNYAKPTGPGIVLGHLGIRQWQCRR
jgi:hypothetical protein